MALVGIVTTEEVRQELRSHGFVRVDDLYWEAVLPKETTEFGGKPVTMWRGNNPTVNGTISAAGTRRRSDCGTWGVTGQTSDDACLIVVIDSEGCAWIASKYSQYSDRVEEITALLRQIGYHGSGYEFEARPDDRGPLAELAWQAMHIAPHRLLERMQEPMIQ